jgi:hypothetical protein
LFAGVGSTDIFGGLRRVTFAAGNDAIRVIHNATVPTGGVTVNIRSIAVEFITTIR